MPGAGWKGIRQALIPMGAWCEAANSHNCCATTNKKKKRVQKRSQAEPSWGVQCKKKGFL
jgi:hypothetical protein